MIAATVTVSDIAGSLFDLIETATPTQLNEFNTGRVAEVHIQWNSLGPYHLVYKSGTTDTVPGPATINLATDSGFEFDNPTTAPAKGLMVIRGSAGMNVISLKDIYLVAAEGITGTARVTAYTI